MYIPLFRPATELYHDLGRLSLPGTDRTWSDRKGWSSIKNKCRTDFCFTPRLKWSSRVHRRFQNLRKVSNQRLGMHFTSDFLKWRISINFSYVNTCLCEHDFHPITAHSWNSQAVQEQLVVETWMRCFQKMVFELGDENMPGWYFCQGLSRKKCGCSVASVCAYWVIFMQDFWIISRKIFKLAKSEDVLGNCTKRCHSFGHFAAFFFLANLMKFYSLTNIFPQINLCI